MKNKRFINYLISFISISSIFIVAGSGFSTKKSDNKVVTEVKIDKSIKEFGLKENIVTNVSSYSIDFNIALTSAWTGGVLNTGNYFLNDDINLASPITINEGDNVNLCLNGKVLSGNYSTNIFSVSGTLNIYDESTSEHTFKIDSATDSSTYKLATLDSSSTDLTLVGGVITGGVGSDAKNGSAVIQGSETSNVSINGGNIVGNKNINTYEDELDGGLISSNVLSLEKVNIYNNVVSSTSSKLYGGLIDAYSSIDLNKVDCKDNYVKSTQKNYGGLIYSLLINSSSSKFENNLISDNELYGGIYCSIFDNFTYTTNTPHDFEIVVNDNINNNTFSSSSKIKAAFIYSNGAIKFKGDVKNNTIESSNGNIDTCGFYCSSSSSYTGEVSENTFTSKGYCYDLINHEISHFKGELSLTSFKVKNNTFTSSSQIATKILIYQENYNAEAPITLKAVEFIGNKLHSNYGALEGFVINAVNNLVTLTNCKFNENEFYNNDDLTGMIHAKKINISGGEYNNNYINKNADIDSCGTVQGGLINALKELKIQNAKFKNNVVRGASCLVGALISHDPNDEIDDKYFEINGCDFKDNTLELYYNGTGILQGLICAAKMDLIKSSTFENNTFKPLQDNKNFKIEASLIYAKDEITDINNVAFKYNKINNNSITNIEGALLRTKKLVMDNCDFDSNEIYAENADVKGGLIFIKNENDVTIKNTDFTNNKLSYKNIVGGIISAQDANLTLNKVGIKDNTIKAGNLSTCESSTINGGLINCETLNYYESEISNNTFSHKLGSSSNGYFAYVKTGKAVLEKMNVHDNTFNFESNSETTNAINGALIYASESSDDLFKLINSEIKKNKFNGDNVDVYGLINVGKCLLKDITITENEVVSTKETDLKIFGGVYSNSVVNLSSKILIKENKANSNLSNLVLKISDTSEIVVDTTNPLTADSMIYVSVHYLEINNEIIILKNGENYFKTNIIIRDNNKSLLKLNDKNITITLKNKEYFRVYYYAKDSEGSLTYDNNYYLKDSKATILSCTSTMPDNAFKEWNSKEDGNGTIYKPNESVTITSDLYLYAFWGSKSTLEINKDKKSATYSGEKIVYTPSANISVELSCLYYVNSTWTSEAPINAGVYDVKVIFNGNASYVASELIITEALTINKAQAVITFSGGQATYTLGDEIVYPTATSNFGTVKYAITSGSIEEVGTVVITYTVDEADNYLGTTKTYTMIINAAPEEEDPGEVTPPDEPVVPSVPDASNPCILGGDLKLSDNVEFKVEVTNGESVNESISKAELTVDYYNLTDESVKLKDDEVIGVIYDIKLVQTVDGVEVPLQPSDLDGVSTIKIKMLIPSSIDYTKITRILHVHSKDDIETIEFDPSKVVDGVYEIEISRLSEFAFVVQNQKAEPIDDPKEDDPAVPPVIEPINLNFAVVAFSIIGGIVVVSVGLVVLTGCVLNKRKKK